MDEVAQNHILNDFLFLPTFLSVYHKIHLNFEQVSGYACMYLLCHPKEHINKIVSSLSVAAIEITIDLYPLKNHCHITGGRHA